MGLASYLLLVGIYSSAISVAQDISLRKSIRRNLKGQSAFLEKIGTSEMEQVIQKRGFKACQETRTDNGGTN
jgi:hypothetical protein